MRGDLDNFLSCCIVGLDRALRIIFIVGSIGIGVKHLRLWFECKLRKQKIMIFSVLIFQFDSDDWPASKRSQAFLEKKRKSQVINIIIYL